MENGRRRGCASPADEIGVRQVRTQVGSRPGLSTESSRVESRGIRTRFEDLWRRSSRTGMWRGKTWWWWWWLVAAARALCVVRAVSLKVVNSGLLYW